MTQPKPPIVGIDLGTTYSLVSVFNAGEPMVLPNAIGETLTPSAVSVLPDGSIVVGAAAKARATTHPEYTAVGFKRDMGTSRLIQLGGKSFKPQELSALVLGALKKDAEVFLGHPIEEAVVTVPAYFGELQRQATRDAGAIAGLRVDRIVNEPTAAALAYGLHQRARDVKAVVLDLGGGTFDVTVLEIIEGVVEVQATSGDLRLGGDDFDLALAELIVSKLDGAQLNVVRDNRKTWARLLAASESAKRKLSSAASTRIALAELELEPGTTRSFELELRLEEVEAVWAALLDRVRLPITRALADAKLKPGSVDEVLLVGGSTRLPCFVKLATHVFNRLPLRTLPPDEAVAMGAAVQAALKEDNIAVSDMVVTDVAPFSMGIATVSAMGSHAITGFFTPILERGTVIPASRVERFSTVHDRQSKVKLEVFQGERSLCRDNQHLGELTISVPVGPAGKEAIDVRFTYDLNGILEVEATTVSDGKKAAVVLTQADGRLSEQDLAEAQKRMQGLKLHPRDALPNTTALSRADALYAELTGDRRATLARGIASFHAALESQDPTTIQVAREQLIEMTNWLRG